LVAKKPKNGAVDKNDCFWGSGRGTKNLLFNKIFKFTETFFVKVEKKFKSFVKSYQNSQKWLFLDLK
jgi:hypothetical protein